MNRSIQLLRIFAYFLQMYLHVTCCLLFPSSSSWCYQYYYYYHYIKYTLFVLVFLILLFALLYINAMDNSTGGTIFNIMLSVYLLRTSAMYVNIYMTRQHDFHTGFYQNMCTVYKWSIWICFYFFCSDTFFIITFFHTFHLKTFPADCENLNCELIPLKY